MAFWLIIIVLFICGLLCWLLISPLEIEVDTRSAKAELRWLGIGNARIWYDEEWWLAMQIFFYQKTMRFSAIKARPKKIKEAATKRKQKRKWKITRMLKKIISVTRTFRVTEWQLAVDTGDHAGNAQLYPLNFLPYTFGHLHINFIDENFLVLKIRNRPWKILYALLR